MFPGVESGPVNPVVASEVEMPTATSKTRRAALLGLMGLTLAGCGGVPDFKPIPPEELGLKELAAAYRDFCAKNQRGPKNLKELQGKGPKQGFPNALALLKSGELVVAWGAPLVADGGGADAVLAYVKSVPEQGGHVLMQDGRTIKPMTADEFKSARKAGGF